MDVLGIKIDFCVASTCAGRGDERLTTRCDEPRARDNFTSKIHSGAIKLEALARYTDMDQNQIIGGAEAY